MISSSAQSRDFLDQSPHRFNLALRFNLFDDPIDLDHFCVKFKRRFSKLIERFEFKA